MINFVKLRDFFQKSSELEKVRAMVGYVKNKIRCRSQILLDYFGEVSYQECGICDTCLEHKHRKEVVHHEQYMDQILHVLKDKPLFIEELIQLHRHMYQR